MVPARRVEKTVADIPYGTTEIANKMKRIYHDGAFQGGNVFAMVGHGDGIIGFATTADEAEESIMRLLGH